MNNKVESLAAAEGRIFVLLQVRGKPFALPSEQARAVTPVGRITRIPHAPREVRGVANWRGRVITLYDLGEALGLPGKTPLASYAVILASDEADLDVAILAEQVKEVRAIPDEILQSLSPAAGLYAGVIDLDGKPVMVLDLKTLLQRFMMAVFAPSSPA